MKRKANAAIPAIIVLLIILAASITFLWASMPEQSTQNSEQTIILPESQKGLVAHYEFEKLVSGQTPDSSGNGNTGFVGNQVSMTGKAAVGESAFRFNGAFREQGGSVTIPNSACLQFQDEMTVSLWVKADNWENIGDWTFETTPDSPHLNEYFKIHNLIDRRNHWSTMDWELIYQAGPAWEKQSGLYVWFANEKRERYDYGEEKFTRTQSTVFSKLGNNLQENEWYLITITKNNEWWSLYLNGKLISTEKRENTVGSSDDIHIGEPFSGSIDDVRIYNKALSPEQVANLYSMKNPDWVPVFS